MYHDTEPSTEREHIPPVNNQFPHGYNNRRNQWDAEASIELAE
jgi:hypothetical protein